MEEQVSGFAVKKGLAEMLKGGVIMDVVTPDQAKIAELQSHLVSLDHLQHQIIHENADSKALYELTSDQKIHFIQDEGLIVKDRQHSLVTLGHESEASLKAFNHYLNLIEVSIGRQQPDFELFTKLVTSTWGRKILQKAESLDKNKVFITGNTVIDALFYILNNTKEPQIVKDIINQANKNLHNFLPFNK